MTGPIFSILTTKTACVDGCCRETLRASRCGYFEGDCSPSLYGLGSEWISNGGGPFYCDFARQRPKINGGCNSSDFSPPTTCAAYEEQCQTYDPNEPPYCQQVCVDFSGVELLPCYYDGQPYPRSYSDWYIYSGGSCCPSGQCPSWSDSCD